MASSNSGGNEVPQGKFENTEGDTFNLVQAGAEEAFREDLPGRQSSERSLSSPTDGTIVNAVEQGLIDTELQINQLQKRLEQIGSVMHSVDPATGTTWFDRLAQNDPKLHQEFSASLSQSPLGAALLNHSSANQTDFSTLPSENTGGANFNTPLADASSYGATHVNDFLNKINKTST